MTGPRILLTRAADVGAPLAAALRRIGARVDCRPSFELVEPRDGRLADRALDAVAAFDWLVFTSAHGVRFFQERLRERGLRPSAVTARIAVVGPATARAVEQAGYGVDVEAERSDGSGLAATLGARLGRGQRVLVVRPEVAAGDLPRTLEARGAVVDAPAFYRNVAHRDAGETVAALIDGRYGGVVFTSPSSYLRLAEVAETSAGALRSALGRVTVVAIGETTAAALRDAGIEPSAVAREPTVDGLVEAVVRAALVLPSAASRRNPEAGVDTTERRPTALHALHVEAGARMVPFAGWDMPVQYAGVLAEHNAVRERAGLFDVSHMGEAAIRGPRALDLLQRVTCNDVSRLAPGRAQYTALTTPEGTFVDDLLIYMLDAEDYLLVLNAANTAKDLAWLERHAAAFDTAVEDETERWSLMALQGPVSREILQPHVEDDLEAMKYYRLMRTRVDGVECIVSRTGYTGEYGFEIYAPTQASPAAIWTALCATGEPLGLQRVGLAARDTLRLEAKMALYGNDIDETTTVLEADLSWIVKLDKGEFVGREALARQQEQGVSRKLAGFEMDGRAIARQGYPVRVDGREVGRVTSGSFAPFLKKSIGLAYLPIESTEPGTALEVLIRGKAEPGRVVPTPFYKRPR